MKTFNEYLPEKDKSNIKEFKNNKGGNVEFFVEKMFEARQVSHNFHLKTKSYSQHEALKEFYNGLLEFADDFVETYQGQYGLIESVDFKTPKEVDIVNYLENFCKISKDFRNNIKESHLQNIIDEIVALTYKTIYKLKFLK